MRAITIAGTGGLDQLTLSDLPDPGHPGAGEIRVRIHASSLNFHDFAVCSGWIPIPAGRIPMADGAGVVEAVGAGVTEFATGDHVVSCFFPGWQDGPAGDGDVAGTPGDGIDGYARELVVAPATWFTRAPAGYSHAEAATLTTAGLTAWRALIVDGGLKAGDTVLLLGTGGVSIFALQIAKTMGARVIITSSSDAKLERARALGADETINYRTHPEWAGIVRDLTGGVGVDHILEVGGPGTLGQSLQAVRGGGHVSLIGALTGIEGTLSMVSMLRRQIKLQGVMVGSRRHQQDFVRAVETTGLRPVIDRSFPLEGIADAFRLEASGGHFGKIVLEY